MDEVKARDQQYFPTYHLSDEAADVALKEYELAASTLAAEQRVLNMSTSFLVGLIGIAAAFYKDNSSEVEKVLKSGLQGSSSLIALALMFALVTLAATSYFADTRRSVVLASRKIVILRRMLGLSYGQIELVLPKRRIEGANEPYHIPMFHGWLSAKAVPIYCLSVTSSVLVWLLLPRETISTYFGLSLPPYMIGIMWGALVAFYYRAHLLDQYETILRIITISTAKILRQQLIIDFEYTIYRARLAVIEANRLEIPLSRIIPILIELEDRDFKKHIGVSPKAIIAAAYRYIERRKRSGGSTITQQIARTLFIKNMTASFRRKFVEILLALWFDRQFSKDELASLHICAVRYEQGIHGISEAIRYFFPERSPKDVTVSEIFFLIERIANIRSKLIIEKVSKNIEHLLKKNILNADDISDIIAIYQRQIAVKKIDSSMKNLEDLERMLTKTPS